MNLGFIGAGKMAHALAKGFIAAGLTKGNQLTVSCAPEDILSAETFKQLGATINYDNKEIIKRSEVTIIAVKPDVIPQVLTDIKDVVTKKNLLLSVAMGVTIKQLEQGLPGNSRVIRVMPNTPALVREGATVYVSGTHATEQDCNLTKQLFGSVGICERVSEYILDPVTALSGSGPAFIYTIIEALSDGAVRMGMARDLAYKLAAQTVVGAGKMVLNTQMHPGVLKDNVTSPAGSTCEGLHHLEENAVRSAFIKAIEGATKKCRETTSKH
ncbi:pyrroline-5-carboxylate reductase 1, mitochondrial [Halyomorpha halys]|uniref:pyrroline-5-carboxylate reductase 1, mitochondrial n=1 Tax=Halyomorpha halys TaxID=286706 RepID=UPI0006D4DC3A|nr:pyrroline-5-carboxylate reductase 1, mitochondrial [Halyomorpha halys]